MICCSIGHRNARQISAILGKVEMAEIRLDLCGLSEEEIESVFGNSDTPLIATCRTSDGDYHRAEHLLAIAIKAGAHYADLEIEAPKPVSKRIARACAEWGTTLIRSYHNFECTPALDELRAIVDRCRHHDGEVVKIATTANSSEDVETVLGLYRYYTPESLIAFAMGPAGIQSRIDCLRLGAPLSFASPDEGQGEDWGGPAPTAPGQMEYSRMYGLVYGNCKPLDIPSLRVPASKSFAQRAVIAAALADGTSVLEGYTPCGDSESALNVAAQMGATIKRRRTESGTISLEITGIGAGSAHAAALYGEDEGRNPIPRTVQVGESGLLARLMMPVGCCLYPEGVRIEGAGTLLQRPLQGAAGTMAALGCTVAGISDIGGAAETDDLTVPVELTGPLKPGRTDLDGGKSSQLISGALMALPLCCRSSSLHVMNPVSIPYIYITLDILRSFGVKVRSEMYGGRQLLADDWGKCTEIVLKIKENQGYRPARIELEGDWSAAAPFLAAGAIFGSVRISGLDTASLQADLTVMDILVEAGASVSQDSIDSGEQDLRFKVPETLQLSPDSCPPAGTVTVKKAPLQAVRVDLTNCPDLFPVTAVFCAFCQGVSSLRGVHRLSHKESDRAEGIRNMLEQLGVGVQIKGDDMLIEGESFDSRILSGRLLKGGEYTSNHDHRMVMALSLAGLGADGRIKIDDVGCVEKSFPAFNDIWKKCISYE